MRRRGWNQNPKPFVWTATVESIQEKHSRCRRTLEEIKPGSTGPKFQIAEMNCLVISQTQRYLSRKPSCAESERQSAGRSGAGQAEG